MPQRYNFSRKSNAPYREKGPFCHYISAIHHKIIQIIPETSKVTKKRLRHPASPKNLYNSLIFNGRYLMAQKMMKSGAFYRRDDH